MSRRSAVGSSQSAVGPILIGFLFILGAAVLVAQGQVETRLETGFGAELLTDLSRLEQKLIGLAEAVPQEEFGWRPAEGVRSLGEVYIHQAVSNHRILEAVGVSVPENIEQMEEITDKEEVISSLKHSIEALRQAVLATPGDGLDDPVEFFGRSWSKRAIFYLAATHMHEHLCQSIAYARSIGVVPPWSQQLSPEEGE